MLQEAIEALVLMLSPFAPHMAEELWEQLGPRGRPRRARAWPAYDPAVAQADEIVVPVQVNGKVRGRADGAGRQRGGRAARGGAGRRRRSRAHGRQDRRQKVIVAKGKLVNVVVKS